MNNSRFALDSVSLKIEEPTLNEDLLKQREQKLVRIIEAIREIQDTKSWSSLRSELFDNLPDNLNKQINQEAKKLNPDTNRLNRLAGELKWAEGFSDLKKLEEIHMVELQSIRKQLHG